MEPGNQVPSGSDCTRRPSSGLCSLTDLEAVPGGRAHFHWSRELKMRTPAEPTYPPIHQPIDPPENPDVPVREPDPEDPNEI
jgi:hypothetical protein